MIPRLQFPRLTIDRTKCEDGVTFLGDGSLAGVPTPKLGGKGIRPVIKVVDDKCLYVTIYSDSPSVLM